MYLQSQRPILKLALTLFSAACSLHCILAFDGFGGDNNGPVSHSSASISSAADSDTSYDSMMLPKRLVQPMESRIHLHLTENEIENAFNLGKDMVYRNLRLEDELISSGNNNSMFFFVLFWLFLFK